MSVIKIAPGLIWIVIGQKRSFIYCFLWKCKRGNIKICFPKYIEFHVMHVPSCQEVVNVGSFSVHHH